MNAELLPRPALAGDSPAERIAVRVVSLAGSPRRTAMATQLDAVPGLDWAFFDACTAPPPALRHDAGCSRHLLRRDMTAGEIGCYASHWSLWRWLDGTPGLDALVVLEDDLLIDPAFFAALPRFLAAVPRAGYLRLYAKVPVPSRRIGSALGRHVVRYRNMPFGTQAYIVRRDAAAAFTRALSVIERPVDDAMDRWWAHGVPALGVVPHPVIEVGVPSEIGAKRRETPPFGLASWVRWQAARKGDAARRAFANLRYRLAEPELR